MAFAWSGESTQGARLRVERRLQQHRGRSARRPRPRPASRLAPAAPPRPRAHRVAVPSRAAQNYWVRPAFGFNIQEVIDLFDSWGWVVNVFDGLEEDDKYRLSVVKCTPPVYRTPFARGGSMYPLEVYPPLGGLVVPLA